MNSVLFESHSIQDIKLLIILAKELGVKSKVIVSRELEDFVLGEEIKKGMQTKIVSESEVLEALAVK